MYRRFAYESQIQFDQMLRRRNVQTRTAAMPCVSILFPLNEFSDTAQKDVTLLTEWSVAERKPVRQNLLSIRTALNVDQMREA